MPDEAGPADLLYLDFDTVSREGGDCEKRSMWLCAVLAWHGWPAWLAWITQEGAPLDHVSAQVEVRGRRLWADATVPGAVLGEWPARAAGRLLLSGGRAVGIY